MSFIMQVKPEDFGLINKGSHWVAPVNKGLGRTIIEPLGLYYSVPTQYMPPMYARTGSPSQTDTITLDMLDRLPRHGALVVESLKAHGVYLEGYNEPPQDKGVPHHEES